MGRGQGELKYSAARLVRLHPELAPVSIDDGPAYRQAHPSSTGFGGIESLEDALRLRRIDARPGIAHGHANACVVSLRADQQFSRSRFYRAHGFDRVEDQVQQDLLNLNTVS